MDFLFLSACVNRFRISRALVTLNRSPIGDTKRSLRSGDQTDLGQVSKSVCSRPYSTPRVSLSISVCDIMPNAYTYCILYFLNYYFVCLSALAGINQHNGKIFLDRYRWNFYGTLLVKVLFRAPSLITHTILRTDLMHEGARPRTSGQSPKLCVTTSKYLSTSVIDSQGQRYLSLSWSALCYYSGTYSYPTTYVVAVTYQVCVYLLYGGPTNRTHRIVNYLVCVI